MPESESEELGRRRLEEVVQKNLEGRLFRYYRNVGSIIIAVLAFFGYTVGWPAIQGQIEKSIDRLVAAPVKSANDSVNAFSVIVNKDLVLLRSQADGLTDAIGKVNARAVDISEQYSTSKQLLEALKGKMQDIQRQQTELDNRLKNVQSTSEALNQQLKFSTATPQDIAKIARVIESLTTQTSSIAEAVTKLQTDLKQPSLQGSQGSIESALTELSTKSGQLVSSTAGAVNLQARAIVYVQFAGGSRDDIKLVTAKLRTDGWSVPAEDRDVNADGQSEVRYFHIEDRDLADRLVGDVNAALKSADFQGLTVKTKDASKNPNISLPRLGVLELWLEIPLRK